MHTHSHSHTHSHARARAHTHTNTQAIEEVSAKSPPFIQSKVKQAMDKVEEVMRQPLMSRVNLNMTAPESLLTFTSHQALDASKPLSKEEYVDDLALTSMARLWDVGKSEPIKVGSRQGEGEGGRGKG